MRLLPVLLLLRISHRRGPRDTPSDTTWPDFYTEICSKLG